MKPQTTEVEPSWCRKYSKIREVTISIKALEASGELVERRIIFIRPKKIRQLHDDGGLISELIGETLKRIGNDESNT